MIAVSNSQYAGGGIRIAPKAEVDDGEADIVILHDLSRLGFLLGFTKTFSGGHIANPKCDYYRGKKITITSDPEMILIPDGEIFGKTPLTVTTMKNAVNIAV